MADMGSIKPLVQPAAIRPLNKDPERKKSEKKEKEESNSDKDKSDSNGKINEYI